MPMYTITSVDREKPWQGQHGPKIDYTVTLKDENGQETKSVVVTQKPDTPKPTVGQTLTGTIGQGKFGPKFEKEYTGGKGGDYYKPRDPAEIAAIQRQGSQRTAVMFLQAKVAAGAVNADNFPTMDEFRKAVDWFERDIANNAPPYAKPKNSTPKPTGQSDLPDQTGEFEPLPVSEEDMAPFTGAPS